MRIDVLTLFPAMFAGPLDVSIVQRARDAGILDLRIHNLRDWTHDRHKTVDDRPFGGGPGMVLMPGPVVECVEAVQALCAEHGVAPSQVLLGGRSMGGRMCSMAVAEGLGAAGLVLVSYPLHPPKRPDRLRTEHFPAIGVPCLFVSGTRDGFATPDELQAATAAIAGPVTHRWIDGGRHELDRDDDAVVAAVAAWLAGTSS